MVFLNGVFQDTNSYTYPSIVYGTQGIDIGDNTASKLLATFKVISQMSLILLIQ